MLKKLLIFLLPTVIVAGIVVAGPYAGGPYTNPVPDISTISGLGAGIATWLGTPSSANLRSALTDETGTGAAYFQSGDLGTPTAGVLTNATGLPISTGVAGLAANVATFLGTSNSANLRSALTDETGTGAAYFQSGDLGTPTAGVLTNATGLPISTGVAGLAANVATFLGTSSSANLRSALTDETGTGAAYFQSGDLGTPTAGVLTNATGLPISTGVSGLAANVATFLGTPSSANLAAALTNETGTGAAVFGTAPTISDAITSTAHILTSNFSKTDTNLASMTGLSQSLTAAGTYSCNGFIHFTTAPSGSNGAKIALATSDTLTVTTLMFNAEARNGAAFVTGGQGTATALGSTAFGATQAMTDIIINAAINVNAAGTLQVQVAENTASGTIASTAGNARWDCRRAS